MRRLTVVFLLSGAMLTAAPGYSRQAGIQVGDAWSRAAMQGPTGGFYQTVTDSGAADRLTGVASPAAERADLHESFVDQGVMKMRPVTSLPVAPGQPIKLTPGGHHIMLMNLKKPLNVGDHVAVTLTFEKAGPVSVEAIVAKAGASAPPDHAPDHAGADAMQHGPAAK